MLPDPHSYANLCNVEISKRPRKTWDQTLNAVLFTIVFNLGCLLVNASHFVFLLPLKLLPFPWANSLYEEGIRYTKGAFGCLLILACQWFAPTSLRVTFEREGAGRFTDKEIDEIVKRDSRGRVIELQLPKKLVLIANHQVSIYADWWYVWCLTYFMNMHKDVLIVLKKSLKWVPIVGWGMQFFRFIFLARSWASDRLYLSAQLSSLGTQAQQDETPLALIIYPEGTLVSKDTRPLSKKYADKLGISDMMHVLLPRATGLHYSLRSLAPRIPSLQLLDITVAYPGIPRLAYGQSYYTLRSIFFDRIPPPIIHVHLRMFDVAQSVPIGDLSASNPKPTSKKAGLTNPQAVEVDVPEHERLKFEAWLQDLWREKDRKMEEFLTIGSFTASQSDTFDIPLKLRRHREMVDAFCFFGPALVGYAWTRIKQGSR